ncbi:MAG: penicillin acylase family protein [Gemmatimonadales bacterium]
MTPRRFAFVLALLATCATGLRAQSTDTTHLTGLARPVEIIRDRWGISHIYASNEHDLFFAQGYSAASDRLFQLELWRRQATGTVAELLGPREVRRDIGARLFRFRGDMQKELLHYHPHGPAIVRAFVDGINAYIGETEKNPKLLPLEFRLLGTKPQRWTSEVVVSRHGGLLGNIERELALSRAVTAVGAAKVKELWSFHPGDPDLTIDPAIDATLLSAPILALYEAFRAPVRFQPADLVASARNDEAGWRSLAAAADSIYEDARVNERRDVGSNNWVVSGRLALNGQPMMANDPHRAQSAPSLRYWAHLVAPGWNVIGGGEPEIPGVSIGHNEVGAWGLTIFATDGEDLYVYKTNPTNARQYRYGTAWEAMRVVREAIAVKGASPVNVELKYTRHGPVVYEDTVHHVAYAVRAAWLEPGAAPYLASLRMDQATTWEQFREACAFSYIPGENMVWADRAGHIGWQAVGIAPIRSHWSGLVAVPGDGRYEWGGYLPIKEKPHSYDPPAGYIATANNDLIPPGYPHMNAVGFEWTDPYRWSRISEVLGAGRKLAVADMMRLQTDYLSIPARTLVPLLRNLDAREPAVEAARRTLLAWDFVLDPGSVAAGIYEAWHRHLVMDVSKLLVPEAARPFLPALSTARVVGFAVAPTGALGANPARARDSLLVRSLEEAVAELSQQFGADTAKWVWGQATNHHALIMHPLSAAVNAETRRRLDVGPAPRGGDGETVGATGYGRNQTSGASFRIVTDVSDWEQTVGINTPGQSGDPASPHYRDLFEMWATDRYFPVPYARQRVEAAAERVWRLVPGAPSVSRGAR